MEDRRFVYAFVNPHNTVSVVNYDATNSDVKSFLSLFDIWHSQGEYKMSIDDNHQEVWFECSKEFLKLAEFPTFKEAFLRMGVRFTLEYPFTPYLNTEVEYGKMKG